MYRICKTFEVSAAHSLKLPYESKCTTMHGHNWRITVYCQAQELNDEGMVVDFSRVKAIIKGQLDHKCLNDVLPFNPTAENMAHWICTQVPHCYRVDVQESEGNTACYEKED